MKQRIFRFFPAICWFMLSFYLLTLPGSRFPKFGWFEKIYADKLVHICMFAILVLLFLVPFKQQRQKVSFLTAIIFATLALGYGIAMEFVQKNFIPNRSFELSDIVADGIGSFLPVIWLLIKHKLNTAALKKSFIQNQDPLIP